MSFASSYVAVAFIGLIHGLEPGHGWPIAVLIALNKRNRFLYGALASVILALAHFVSSIAVLLVYYMASLLIDFSSPYFRYIVATVLVVLGLLMLIEKGGEKNGNGSRAERARAGSMSLKELAVFALILGFAHEEEFMLLALAVGGIDPLLLIIVYASAVTVSIIGVTSFAIKGYSLVETQVRKYEKFIPKITGLVLFVLAFLFVIGFY